MNPTLAWLVVLTILIPALPGCGSVSRNRDLRRGITTITVSGPEGARVVTTYWKGNQSFGITNSLPHTISEVGISTAEVRKVNSQETITVDARFQGEGMTYNFSTTAGPGIPGARVDVRNGLSLSNLKE